LPVPLQDAKKTGFTPSPVIGEAFMKFNGGANCQNKPLSQLVLTLPEL
jgi:hypothetical protein